MSLKGKRAIVTGSTSGIGLGIATALAAEGADLVINGMGDATAIEKERSHLEKTYGIRCIYSGADMSKPEQIREMVATAVRELGGVDILVNNAGIQFVAPIDQFPEDKWDQIIAINLSACFHATKAAATAMKPQKWGRIINIASAHGLVASHSKAAYVAAKHGVVGLTKVTALDFAADGITANAVCPGFVNTPLVQKQVADKSAETGLSTDETTKKYFLEKHAIKEFVEVPQLASLVVYLCSDAAATLTGTALPMDAGWTAQ